MESNIIKEIKKLKKDISPRQEWVTLSRDILLNQINPQKERQTIRVGVGDYFNLFTQVFRQRLLEPAVIMLLVLGVFLGSSLTINAAFYSLPGDKLYQVKLALERTHVALIPDEEKKVELKMEFAQKRMAEFEKIVAQTDINSEEKQKKIETVVQEFKNNVVAVTNHLNRIKQADNGIAINEEEREKTLRIALTIGSKSEQLAKFFDEKVEELDEIDKLGVEEIVAEAVASVLETSQSAQELADESAPTEEVIEEEGEEGVVEGAEVEETGLESEEVEVIEEEGAEEETRTVDASTVLPEETIEEVIESDISETTQEIIE